MGRGWLLVLDLIFLAAVAAQQQPFETSQGTIEQRYTEYLTGPKSKELACGRTLREGLFRSHFAGIDLAQHPDACGRCVVIACADRAACSYSPFPNVTVAIIDDCPGCGAAHVALNSLAARELTGRRLQVNEKLGVNWSFIDCNAYDSEPIISVSAPPPLRAPPPSPPPRPASAPAPEPFIQSIGATLRTPTSEDITQPLANESATNMPPSPEIFSQETILPAKDSTQMAPIAEVIQTPPPTPGPFLVQSQNQSSAGLLVESPIDERPREAIAEVKVGAQAESLLPFFEYTATALAPATEVVNEVVGATLDDVRELQPPALEEPVLSILPLALPPLMPAAPAPEPESEIFIGNVTHNSDINPTAEEIEALQPSVEVLEEAGPSDGSTAQNSNQSTRSTGMVLPGYYDPFPSTAFADGACGFGGVSPHFQTRFAGASFRGSQASAQSCGACLTLRCTDPSTCPGGTSTTVQITEYCGSCAENDFLLSPQALKAVTGPNGPQFKFNSAAASTKSAGAAASNSSSSNVGKGNSNGIEIEWEIVPCREFTQGGLILHVIPGANEYYVQLSVSNAAQKIRQVKINGQALKRMAIGWEGGEQGGRWEWQYQGTPLELVSSGAGSSIVFEVTGEDGRKASTLLKSLEAQQLPDSMQI